MIYRAIIEEVIDRYQARVRIPILHQSKESAQSIPTSSLPIASVCTVPNSHINLTAGDIVIISFENNDDSKPIIIGYLYRDVFTESALSSTLNSIDVISTANLPKSTKVGEISYSEIFCLKGLKNNLEKQLSDMLERIENIEKNLNKPV